MAKWGEGDPRWIVEHRDDGKNVGGWHWSEVNKMEWTKKRLAELLPGTEALLESPGPFLARVTAVRSVSGEAMLTTRKGNRKFAFYDLKLTVAWEATPLAEQPAAAAASAEAPDSAGEPAAAVAAGAAEAAEALAGASLECGAAGSGEADGAAAAGGAADGVPAAQAPAAASSQPAISGEISVAEFGSGSDHEDLELSFTVTGGSSAEQVALRRHAEQALWPAVLQRLEQYVRELGEEAA